MHEEAERAYIALGRMAVQSVDTERLLRESSSQLGDLRVVLRQEVKDKKVLRRIDQICEQLRLLRQRA